MRREYRYLVRPTLRIATVPSKWRAWALQATRQAILARVLLLHFRDSPRLLNDRRKKSLSTRVICRLASAPESDKGWGRGSGAPGTSTSRSPELSSLQADPII